MWCGYFLNVWKYLLVSHVVLLEPCGLLPEGPSVYVKCSREICPHLQWPYQVLVKIRSLDCQTKPFLSYTRIIFKSMAWTQVHPNKDGRVCGRAFDTERFWKSFHNPSEKSSTIQPDPAWSMVNNYYGDYFGFQWQSSQMKSNGYRN